MKNSGSRNLVILVVSVWAFLFSFYGFLAYRARMWSPRWAIEPTTKVFIPLPPKPASDDESSLVDHGRQLYRELYCGICHGPEGEGGVKNPNADPEEVIPNLFDLSDAFTWQDLIDKMKKGAHPAKIEEEKAEPPLDMPSWDKALSQDELEPLAHYLFSLTSSQESEGEEEEEEP